MHHHDDGVFEKLRFRANTLKRIYRCVFKYSRIQKRFQMSPFPKKEGLRLRSLQCGREVKTYRKRCVFK